MWPDTPIIRLFGCDVPIVQAPMAGCATPALVAAVSNAGGLGSIAAAYDQPDAIRAQIKAVRHLTDRPFAVNLFLPTVTNINMESVDRAITALTSWREKFGISGDPPPLTMPDFEAQLDVVLSEKPRVFSFTFGSLPPERIGALKSAGIIVAGTATTVGEAERLEADGVDAVIAQGSEAGAHRGGFLAPFAESEIGLMALVPAMADKVRIPIIAAGGIMDGRGIAAALMLGAKGVQMGTAFLVTDESGAAPVWKKSVLEQYYDSTKITRVFSGRPARSIRNDMMMALEKHESGLPGFPALNVLTRAIRSAAGRTGDAQALSLFAGQAAPLARAMPAVDLVRKLALETGQRLDEGFQG